MDICTKIALKIIIEQESIIGPVAFEQASKVSGLGINKEARSVSLLGDQKVVLEKLVKQYEELFGRTSVEVCKEAVKDLVAQAPKDQIPQILL